MNLNTALISHPMNPKTHLLINYIHITPIL